MAVNLGNVVGLIRSVEEPDKKYVLWARINDIDEPDLVDILVYNRTAQEWQQINSQTVDLSNYYTKDEVAELFDDLLDDVPSQGNTLNKLYELVNSTSKVYTRTVKPTASTDSGSGYKLGDTWLNSTTQAYYTCLDASSGAAVWRVGGIVDAKYVMNNAGVFPTSVERDLFYQSGQSAISMGLTSNLAMGPQPLYVGNPMIGIKNPSTSTFAMTDNQKVYVFSRSTYALLSSHTLAFSGNVSNVSTLGDMTSSVYIYYLHNDSETGIFYLVFQENSGSTYGRVPIAEISTPFNLLCTIKQDTEGPLFRAYISYCESITGTLDTHLGFIDLNQIAVDYQGESGNQAANDNLFIEIYTNEELAVVRFDVWEDGSYMGLILSQGSHDSYSRYLTLGHETSPGTYSFTGVQSLGVSVDGIQLWLPNDHPHAIVAYKPDNWIYKPFNLVTGAPEINHYGNGKSGARIITGRTFADVLWLHSSGLYLYKGFISTTLRYTGTNLTNLIAASDELSQVVIEDPSSYIYNNITGSQFTIKIPKTTIGTLGSIVFLSTGSFLLTHYIFNNEKRMTAYGPTVTQFNGSTWVPVSKYASFNSSVVVPIANPDQAGVVKLVQNLDDSDPGSTPSTPIIKTKFDEVDSAIATKASASALATTNSTVGTLGTTVGDHTSQLADKADKSYVDSALAGLKWKTNVRAATTGNITLSGAQTIDTINIIAGDRVLVKDNTTGSQNGVYVAAAGAWARATDADTALEIQGMAVLVLQGSQAETAWTLVTDSITLGSTALVYTRFNPNTPGATTSISGTVLIGVDADVQQLVTPTNTTKTVTIGILWNFWNWLKTQAQIITGEWKFQTAPWFSTVGNDKIMLTNGTGRAIGVDKATGFNLPQATVGDVELAAADKLVPSNVLNEVKQDFVTKDGSKQLTDVNYTQTDKDTLTSLTMAAINSPFFVFFNETSGTYPLKIPGTTFEMMFGPTNPNGAGRTTTDNYIWYPTLAAPVVSAESNVTGTSFSANWAAVTGATAYKLTVIDVTTGLPISGFNELNVANVLTYSVTGLSSGHQYKYQIKAINAEGIQSPPSAEESVTTLNGVTPALLGLSPFLLWDLNDNPGTTLVADATGNTRTGVVLDPSAQITFQNAGLETSEAANKSMKIAQNTGEPGIVHTFGTAQDITNGLVAFVAYRGLGNNSSNSILGFADSDVNNEYISIGKDPATNKGFLKVQGNGLNYVNQVVTIADVFDNTTKRIQVRIVPNGANMDYQVVINGTDDISGSFVKPSVGTFLLRKVAIGQVPRLSGLLASRGTWDKVAVWFTTLPTKTQINNAAAIGTW